MDKMDKTNHDYEVERFDRSSSKEDISDDSSDKKDEQPLQKELNQVVQQHSKTIAKNEITVTLPPLELGELKQGASAFAQSLAESFSDSLSDIENFQKKIDSADNKNKIQAIVSELIVRVKERITTKEEYSEVATAWLEKMVNIYGRSGERVEKHLLDPLEKTLGKLDKIFEALGLEKYIEIGKKIEEHVDGPLERLDDVFSGVSLALIIMEGGAHITRGNLLNDLRKELKKMENNLENMPAGQAKIDLQNSINSLKNSIQDGKSELLHDVFSYFIEYGKDVASITKKVMTMIVKTLSPGASIGFASAGAALIAIQKSYDFYRGIQTQLGIKKMHIGSSQREATYNFNDEGTKQLYLKKEIQKDDPKFLEEFGNDMVDKDYTSATAIYDAMKAKGIKLGVEDISWDAKDKVLNLKVSNTKIVMANLSEDFFIFLKGRLVLDKIAAEPNNKNELEKTHRKVLNQREKFLQNKDTRFQFLVEMKEFVDQSYLLIKDSNFIEKIKNGQNEIKSAEDLYKKLTKSTYSLKASQLTSEGKIYYLTGPNVMGGYPLKMRISKEMFTFLSYQALSSDLNKESDESIKNHIKKKIKGLKSDYDKIMGHGDKIKGNPVKAQEVLSDFRALLQNESARSAFIQNKVEPIFKSKLDEDQKLIKFKIVENKLELIKQHKDLQTPQALYDHLVGSFSLKKGHELFDIKLPVSLQIDPSRLGYNDKKEPVFKHEGGTTTPISKELYDFLRSRGNVVPKDQDQGLYENLIMFIYTDSVLTTLSHDAAMANIRNELIVGSLQAPDSILNKRKVVEEEKINRSSEKLTTVLDEIGKDTNLNPIQKLEKLRSAGFHLESLLEYDKNKGWVLKIEEKSGLKEKALSVGKSDNKQNVIFLDDDKGKQEKDVFEVEQQPIRPISSSKTNKEFVSISDDLAKLISPEKFSEKVVNEPQHASIENITSIKGDLEKELEKVKNEIKNGSSSTLERRQSRLDSAIKEIESLQKIKGYSELHKNKTLGDLNLYISTAVGESKRKTGWWKNIPKDQRMLVEDSIEQFTAKLKKIEDKNAVASRMKEDFVLQAAFDGRLDRWIKEYKITGVALPSQLREAAMTRDSLFNSVQVMMEERGIYDKYSDLAEKADGELSNVLDNGSIKSTLATRRGQGIDTRNTLFRQMTKVIKTEKLRQERIFNAHKVRASFVGLIGSTGLAVVGALAVASVIALSASLVGLAVLGFGLIMTAVGLVILKAKKPNLFKATMKGAPFRLAFNNMKKSWNTMRQKKIEKKPFFDKAEVALISANVPPKAEVDRFFKIVELNKGQLPPWNQITAPMRRMIAGLEGVSVEKLGGIWDKYNVNKKILDNLLQKIQKHREPEAMRKIEASLIDDFILRLQESNKAPEWKNIDPKMQKALLVVCKKTDETIQDHWEDKFRGNGGEMVGVNIEELIEDLNEVKSMLEKEYGTYNKLEARLERQKDKIVTYKAKIDLAAENDFALKLATRMGQKKGERFDPATLAWEELVAGEGIEDEELVKLLQHEMGLDLTKIKDKEGIGREAMEDDFLSKFRGFLAMEGQAFVQKLQSLEKEIQNDFANPVKINFVYKGDK